MRFLSSAGSRRRWQVESAVGGGGTCAAMSLELAVADVVLPCVLETSLLVVCVEANRCEEAEVNWLQLRSIENDVICRSFAEKVSRERSVKKETRAAEAKVTCISERRELSACFWHSLR